MARTNLGRDQRVVIGGHLDTVPENRNMPSERLTADGEDRTALYVVGGIAALALVGGIAYFATRKPKPKRRGFGSYGSPAYNPRRSRRRGRR